MRRIILFSLFVFGLFLLGCDGGGDAPPRYDAYTGSDGLVIDFERDMPPEEIFENQIFDLMVHIENKGADSVEQGLLLLGYEEDIIEPQQSEYNIDLYGRGEARGKGEEEIVNFRLKSKLLDPQVEVIETLFSVTACYEYTTTFGSEVCVDTDPLGQRIAEKNCAAETIKSSGQGAPVVISQVDVVMAPHEDEGKVRPTFKFTIENKGDGIVYNKDKIEAACKSSDIAREDINTIFVRDARLSQDYPLDCSPKREGFGAGYIKLREDESVIRCTYEEGIDADTAPFSAPLYLELEYGYSETISDTTLVRKDI